jgi:hypothetical protein
MSTPETWQRMQYPGTTENPSPVPVIASATSIDLSAVTMGRCCRISGTTDIANIKPPFPDFAGPIDFLFDASTPPDFVSGGSPATGYYAIALTKSMVQYEVVTLYFNPDLGKWFPSMT